MLCFAPAAAADGPKAAMKPGKAESAEATSAGPDHWSYWSDNTNRALLAAQAANEGGNYGELYRRT
jgi:sarcosine oxidase gamma subunit